MTKGNDIKVLVSLAICTAMDAAADPKNIAAGNVSDAALRDLLAEIDKLQAEVVHLRAIAPNPDNSLSWYQRILKSSAE